MGNPNDQLKSSSSSSTIINHFSHPHPLQLSNHIHGSAAPSPCKGCKLDVVYGGLVYSCTKCNYFLHTKCSEMPQQITHPSHPNHVLSLLPKPVYVEGVFSCDACGKKGNGFSYRCHTCSLDYRILCVSLPLSTFIQRSHQHQLDLVFSPPYPTKTFSCDLCKKPGSNHWLYRCSSCEFDVHLTCVNSNHHPSQPTAAQPPRFPQHTGPNNTSFRPQFQRPMNNIAIARPVYQMSNPNSFAYCPPVMSSQRPTIRAVQSPLPQTTRVLAAPSYARPPPPMPMQQQQSQILPMQVFAPVPTYTMNYTRPPPPPMPMQLQQQSVLPMQQQQQSVLPMQNSMNGGSAGYTYGDQNAVMEQMISSGMNAAIANASAYQPPSMGMGGGTGSNDIISRGMYDDGNPQGVSHLQDYGGGDGNYGSLEYNGYDANNQMDGGDGNYGSSDYNGYDENNLQGGVSHLQDFGGGVGGMDNCGDYGSLDYNGYDENSQVDTGMMADASQFDDPYAVTNI